MLSSGCWASHGREAPVDAGPAPPAGDAGLVEVRLEDSVGLTQCIRCTPDARQCTLRATCPDGGDEPYPLDCGDEPETTSVGAGHVATLTPGCNNGGLFLVNNRPIVCADDCDGLNLYLTAVGFPQRYACVRGVCRSDDEELRARDGVVLCLRDEPRLRDLEDWRSSEPFASTRELVRMTCPERPGAACTVPDACD